MSRREISLKKVIIPITKDTFISNDDKDKNFSDSMYLLIGNNTTKIYNSLLYFDIPDELKNKRIINAELEVFISSKEEGLASKNKELILYSVVDTAIFEELSWSDNISVTEEDIEISIVDSDIYSYVSIDILDLLNGWISGEKINNGIMLSAKNSFELVSIVSSKGKNKSYITVYYSELYEQEVVSVTGATGAIGPMGATGIQGEKGEKGEKGEVGERGPTGSQGINGLEGPIGPTGTTGPIGPTGAMGATGTVSNVYGVFTVNNSISRGPYLAGSNIPVTIENIYNTPSFGLNPDGSITINESGVYIVDLNILVHPGSSGRVIIDVNNQGISTNYLNHSGIMTTTQIDNSGNIPISTIISLNEGDNIAIKVLAGPIELLGPISGVAAPFIGLRLVKIS